VTNVVGRNGKWDDIMQLLLSWIGMGEGGRWVGGHLRESNRDKMKMGGSLWVFFLPLIYAEVIPSFVQSINLIAHQSGSR